MKGFPNVFDKKSPIGVARENDSSNLDCELLSIHVLSHIETMK